MTPPERANFLVNEFGIQRAIDHADWVHKGAIKQVTKEYWSEVLEELKKRKDSSESVKVKCPEKS